MRRRGPHPIHGSDDAACRWLCMSAGQRTREDEEALAAALKNLPYSNGALPRMAFTFDPNEIWRLVR